jgi:hypothetical protein
MEIKFKTEFSLKIIFLFIFETKSRSPSFLSKEIFGGIMMKNIEKKTLFLIFLISSIGIFFLNCSKRQCEQGQNRSPQRRPSSTIVQANSSTDDDETTPPGGGRSAPASQSPSAGSRQQSICNKPTSPPSQNQATNQDANDNIESGTLLEIKVRVHKLSFEANAALNSKLSDEDINRYFSEINEIWRISNIRFTIESIVSETVPLSAISQITSSETKDSWKPKLMAINIFPKQNLLWHLALLRYFPIENAKGVYIPESQTAFFAETDSSGQTIVPSKVAAHELGHSLSLQHTTEPGTTCIGENLMCGGRGGDQLSEGQITQARNQAVLGPALGQNSH